MKNITKTLVGLALGFASPALAAETEYNGYGPTYVVPGQAERTDGPVNYKTTLENYQDSGCDYILFGRGEFQSRADGSVFQTTGWIKNHIVCEDGVYNYTIVHNTDPRYTGDVDNAIWNTWEIVKYTESGAGNTAKR